MRHTVRIGIVAGELPATFDVLREEARREGFRAMERLAAEWASGALRFDRDGERLLAAYCQGVLAGIGGLTLDPVIPGMLRMRRFYVRPAFRGQGIGCRLAALLLRRAARAGSAVTVNAGTADAAAFWEALGFAPDARDGHTHKLDRSQPRRRRAATPA